MFGNARLDDIPPPAVQRLKRSDLVRAHQPAVADDIGGKDCGKPALHPVPKLDALHLSH
jgi:hypothetical protein